MHATDGGQHKDDEDDDPSSKASNFCYEDESDDGHGSVQLEQLEVAVAGNPNSYETHVKVVFVLLSLIPFWRLPILDWWLWSPTSPLSNRILFIGVD